MVWGKTYLAARMWQCGDEVCDCTQPMIEIITPNMVAGAPWIHRKTLWQGAFHSEATIEERAEQESELRKAMEKYKIDTETMYREFVEDAP